MHATYVTDWSASSAVWGREVVQSSRGHNNCARISYSARKDLLKYPKEASKIGRKCPRESESHCKCPREGESHCKCPREGESHCVAAIASRLAAHFQTYIQHQISLLSIIPIEANVGGHEDEGQVAVAQDGLLGGEESSVEGRSCFSFGTGKWCGVNVEIVG
jgi:hypothetical protein